MPIRKKFGNLFNDPCNFNQLILFVSEFILKALCVYAYIYKRGSLNKFPDFFRMGIFIDSTRVKL